MENEMMMQEQRESEQIMDQTMLPVADNKNSVPPQGKKRHWGRVICALLISAAILVGGGYVAKKYVIPEVRYQIGVDRLENGAYTEAISQFELLGDYKEASELILEAENGIEYDRAAALAEQGEYLSAREIYEELGDYRDCRELVNEMSYRQADAWAQQEDWSHAMGLFRKLGSYRDSEERALRMNQEIIYARGKEYFENGFYDVAYQSFASLGDFKDARELAEEAYHLHWLEQQYDEAYALYQRGLWVDAYAALQKIRHENYKDTKTMPDEIIRALEEQITAFAAEGETVKMLGMLGDYEQIDAERAATFREEIIAQGAFELDDSRYNFKAISPIATFSENPTAEEFARLILSMYLNGKTSVTLRPQSTIAYSDAVYNTFINRSMKGGTLADEILPTYASIYDWWIWVAWQDGVFSEITVRMENKNSYSGSEMKAHVQRTDDFCEESVRALMETGLLRNTMSYQQRVILIGEWVGYYLTYDDSKKIHDAWVAVEKTLGVCESYTAIFNKMCNLAGVPTWGQTGDAGEEHIWSIHQDETGAIFYSDSTWADWLKFDHSDPAESREPTVEGFCAWEREFFDTKRSMERRSDENLEELIGKITTDFYGDFLQKPWFNHSKYIWQKTLWDTHKEIRSAERIIAFHQRCVA